MTIRQGNDVILFYRNLKDQYSKDAAIVTYQTEHSFKMSRNADATATKDGSVQSVGGIEYDFSSTALYDRTSETIKMLNSAFDANEMIEVWIVDTLDENEKGEVSARYLHAKISEYEETGATDENVELSLTYAVDKKHQSGEVTLTEDQKNDAQYLFENLKAKTKPAEQKAATK